MISRFQPHNFPSISFFIWALKSLQKVQIFIYWHSKTSKYTEDTERERQDEMLEIRHD